MKVAEIMTTTVLTVGPATSLKDAADVMLDNRISGLPVLSSNGEVLGVVSETDIIFKERLRGAKNGRLGRRTADDDAVKLSARTVGASMTMPALTIGADRPVAEAATLMLDRHVNRLPVVDSDGRLVGLVTRSDLVRAFARDDAEIERELREETIVKDLWLDPDRFEISVQKGEVRIVGQVDTEHDAELLACWAALVPGVVSVDTNLQVLAE